MAIATTAVKKISRQKAEKNFSLEGLKKLNFEISFGKKISGRDLIFFTSQLSLMLEIGAPLNTSLAAIAKQITNPDLQRIVGEITNAVEDGKMLSEVLRKYPRFFSAEYVSLVNAGEDSGHLQEMLDRAVELQEKREEFRAALRGAMTYPLVLCIVTVGVIIFMLSFVFPRFTVLFKGVEEILPPTTRFLMASSGFLRADWPFVVAFIALAWTGMTFFLRTDRGRLAIDRLKITLPLISGVTIKVYISQLLRTLGFLIGSNVPLLEALVITRRGMANQLFSRFVDRIYENVEAGKGIAPAFEETDFIPETVTQMIKTGEEAQKLSPVMLRLSDYYEGEIKGQVKKLTTVIEPVLLILMGIVVGLIVVSLILPIFKLSRVVH